MRIKWLVTYAHNGRMYKPGETCDMSDESGAVHVRLDRATSCDEAGKPGDAIESAVVESATVEPRSEKAVVDKPKPRKVDEKLATTATTKKKV